MKFIPLFGWWFIALAAITLLVLIWLPIYRNKKRSRQVIVTWSRRSVLLLIATLMMLGPSIVVTTRAPGITNVDVIIMVDTTASMGALDYGEGKLRIEGVKQDLVNLATSLQGAHFAIITFDSKADPLLPFTPDAATLQTAITSIDREIYSISNGSRIDEPVALAEQMLKNSQATRPDHSRLVFYLGDGEQTAGSDAGSFDALRQYIDGGSIMGYGSTEGAKMLKYAGIIGGNLDPAKEDSYVQYLNPDTQAFEAAISKIDEPALKKIADETGVSYQNRNQGGDVSILLSQTGTTQIIDEGREIKQFLNMYWLLSIGLVVLLGWEWKLLVDHYVVLRSSREKKQ